MTINKRRKVVRYRGSRNHGAGTKKRRGAGNRGGRGMAGSGKRADQKKPTILKLYGSSYFGKHGFRRPSKLLKKIKTINVEELNKFKDDNINWKELGYDKLLGKGNLNKKVKVSVDHASKSAIEKIKKLGGEVKLNGNQRPVDEPS